MTIKSHFSNDFPFEQIADHPNLEDAGVKALGEFVGRYPHKASANKRGFDKFRTLLADVRAPWKGAVLAFTDAMLAKKYTGEFAKLHNRYAGGDCANCECSQTSSMFMAFCQALYYETREAELAD